MRFLIVFAFVLAAASAVPVQLSASSSASASSSVNYSGDQTRSAPQVSASASSSASVSYNGQTDQSTYTSPATYSANAQASASVNFQEASQEQASQVTQWKSVTADQLANLPPGAVVRKVQRGQATYLKPVVPCRGLVREIAPCAPVQIYRPCATIPQQIKTSAKASASSRVNYNFKRPEITIIEEDCEPIDGQPAPTIVTPEITVSGSSRSTATTSVNGETTSYEEDSRTIPATTYNNGETVSLETSATANAEA